MPPFSFYRALVIPTLLALTEANAQQAVPTVSVIAAEKRPVSEGERFVGRVEAIERVDIRARVTGYLEEVLFKDGERVKAGTPLYRIEKGPFEASIQQTNAVILRARAQLENATLQRQRADELVRTSAISQATRDDRVMSEKMAQGDLASAEANLKTAEINLTYTDIASPIDGQVSRTAVTRGNVVGPDSGVLTTIVSSDPIYVTFPVSQREFIRLAEKHQGQEPNNRNFKVTVKFSNGSTYPQSGIIDFVGVKVDRATDTIAVRASLPNPRGTLIDGQLVQVAVEGDKPQEHVLVPQVALIADQQGPYVFIVENDKVAIRRLKLGQTSGTYSIVAEGLSGGELVVIGGVQTLRPDAPVKAVPAEKPLGG